MSAASAGNVIDHQTSAGGGGGDETSSAASQRAVTIFDEPEHIPNDQSYNVSPGASPKLHRANITGKKLTGRPPLSQNPSATTLGRTISHLKLDDIALSGPPTPTETPHKHEDTRKLFSQVMEWLEEEKAKRFKLNGTEEIRQRNAADGTASLGTRSDQDLALDKLEKILSGFVTGLSAGSLDHGRLRKSSSAHNIKRNSISRAFKRTAVPPQSSDTEFLGDDINVPHVEASLDNSRTLAFTGGSADMTDVEAAQQKDLKYWLQFKQDIVRLTHTLKIRGWRRIPIDKGEVISVERLSGALTNAVYVVKPPKELPEPDSESTGKPYQSNSRPKELLLRIYGPQVEHLIDRDAELGILARLARKKIGPRLLGYFTNGRFEEYLHAKTLESGDLRVPTITKQIAKRMRELHDGVELLPTEREAGPMTFNNWDKWVDRCEKVITWLDLQVKREAEGHEPSSKRYTRRGFVCGVEWPLFRKTYEKYREALTAECGSTKAIQNRLVFAHNDAQYGNLMRLDPPSDSPLLHAVNQHRQLVVIDFEYAGANTIGYEFANHFTEWCYDYHTEPSYACNTNRFPTQREQHAFVRAYVMHRPQFASAASSTPKMDGRDKTNISDFMLDARTPTGPTSIDYDEEEKAREAKVERDVQLLLHEARLWRIANAAFWVAWGLVQAKVPELDDPPKKSKAERVTAVLDKVRQYVHPLSDPLDPDVKEKQEASKHDRPETREKEEAHAEGDLDEYEEDIEEFDYLAYANDRAMLFWGDCLQQGLVKESELPESLLKQVKWVR